MRLSLLLLSFLFLGSTSWAQPQNDDCSTAIALGSLPGCVDQVYSSLGATTSSAGAVPSCFNGGNVQRDVWFSFNTGDQRDVSIFVIGQPNGPNNQALTNPQVALYRSNCEQLSQLACAAAEEGAGQVRLDISNLSRNTDYFIRINDFSPSAAPNAGDFTLCVRDRVNGVNMGEQTGSTAYFGTLFDSGGPDGNYEREEELTFTICPDQPFSCLELEMVDFETEGVDDAFGSDVLNVYEGATTSGPLLASIYGLKENDFVIQTDAACVTLEFVSDFFLELSGFELKWEASNLPCQVSSPDNPTPISSLPFQASGLSTCDGKATVGASACPNDNFLAGPDYVFAYNSPGNECIQLAVEGAAPGTGIAVFDGPPAGAGTRCVAVSPAGLIGSANLEKEGTYYIVVAKDVGCTDFSLTVESTVCGLSPALVDALRSPLNGCLNPNGLPSIFVFEDGFQDMEIVQEVNGGCWINVGDEADFYWFSVQAQIDGQLGFVLRSADVPSDVDLNVWGPFTEDQVIGDPDGVIDFIATNQPIRSSWSPGPEPTGLVTENPFTLSVVEDDFDCGENPGAQGDDFVRAIPTSAGEVYVVLVNDWGNEIRNGGISVDWSPSSLGLLDAIPTEIIQGDTSICPGESAQIELDIGTNSIQWIGNTATLSCTDCPNPVATPATTTTYTAVVESVCVSDTVDITVEVFDLDAGPDQQVCIGETIQINAGSDYSNATYQWSADPDSGVTFSCDDCNDPTQINAPFITADQAGTYTISVSLNTESATCDFQDEMVLTVDNAPAPDYDISERLVEICAGEEVTIGVDQAENGLNYEWFTAGGNTVATTATFQVSPGTSTTYFVNISNEQCPGPSLDSVVVQVYREPVIDVRADTSICRGDTVQLGFGPRERDVTYTWSGAPEILDPENPQTSAIPEQTTTYTLTAVRGACVVTGEAEVRVNPANVEIPQDTIFLCVGDEPVTITGIVSNPPGESLVPTWTSEAPDFDTTEAASITVFPQDSAVYKAEVSYLECTLTDSVLVVIDSLPEDLSIMPADTSICEGQYVILRTPAYETNLYPSIEFQWLPTRGQQSPDSLLNLVATPDTTTTYYRITTNNGCRDSTAAMVEVKPIAQLRVIPSDTLVCRGEEVQFALDKPGELENVMWTPMNNLRCPGGSEQLDCEDPIATALNSVQYMISAEFDGCPVMASTTINVAPQPQVVLTNRTVLCLGESVQLNSASTPGATYVWTASDPNFGTVTDPTPIVSPTETTTYFLNASFDQGELNCEPLMAEITIEVIDEVEVEVEAVPASICSGDEVVLSANAIGGSSQDLFLWTTSDGRELQGPQVTDTPDETTTYFLTYRSAAGCQTLNASVVVQVSSGVEVGISTNSPLEVPEGSEVVLNAEIDTDDPGPLDIVWLENGSSLPDAGSQVTVTPAEDGTEYILIVTTPGGCSDTASIVFDVVEPIFRVPNAFTPDGDGVNDNFRLLASGSYDEIIRFQVFNRWGQLVYDNENGENGWDGTYNGEPQPSDVYVYIITVRTLGGNEVTLEGEVTLIR